MSLSTVSSGGSISTLITPPAGTTTTNLTYNADGSFATIVFKAGATTLATWTFTWTNGQLTSLVKS